MLILLLMKSSVFKYFTITSIVLISCSVKNDEVLIPKNILRGQIRAVKKNIKLQILVHIEAMEISS